MTVQEYRKQLPPFYQLGDKELRDFTEIKVKEALKLATNNLEIIEHPDGCTVLDSSITKVINLIRW